MKLIDMHCDTLMKLLDQPEKSLAELDAEVNLPGLKQAGSMAQFFACFTNLMDYPQPPEWPTMRPIRRCCGWSSG